MEQEALQRLLKLSKRELNSNITMDNILDFCKSLKIVAKSKGTVSLPGKYDDMWHLALLDTEYYPYLCKFIKEPVVAHNPLGGHKLTPRRRTFQKEFSKIYKRKVSNWRSSKLQRKITKRSCGKKC